MDELTAKQLYEFACLHNMENVPLYFRDGCLYKINFAETYADTANPGTGMIIMKGK